MGPDPTRPAPGRSVAVVPPQGRYHWSDRSVVGRSVDKFCGDAAPVLPLGVLTADDILDRIAADMLT